MENQGTFQGQKGAIKIEFSLSPLDKSHILKIQMTNYKLNRRYNLTIDDLYLSERDEIFKMGVRSVQHLFSNLVQKFEGLQITEDGVILFRMNVTIDCYEDSKVYRLEGKQTNINPIELVTHQMVEWRQEMREEATKRDYRIAFLERTHTKFIEDLAVRDERIASLEETNKRISQNLQGRKQDISKLQERYVIVQRENDQTKARNENLNQKITQIQTMNQTISKDFAIQRQKIGMLETKLTSVAQTQQKQQTTQYIFGVQLVQIRKQLKYKLEDQIKFVTDQFKQKIKDLKESIQNQQVKVNQLKTSLQARIASIAQNMKNIMEVTESKWQPFRKDLFTELHSIHKQSFSVKKQLNSLTIKKISHQGEFKNFIGGKLISNRANCFKMELLQTKGRVLYLGIGTKRAFNEQKAFRNPQTLCYNCWDGKVRQLGKENKGGPALNDGDVLTMRVNLLDFRVDWLVNEKSAITYTISSAMREQELYLFVIMCSKEDEVRFIV